MNPETRINQAFLQLRFAIKLFRYFERELVEKEAFDRTDAIHTGQGVLRLYAREFESDRDLVQAAKNVYSTTLGVCAIALESALIEHGLKNDPNQDTPEGLLRSFVYQMRNAFAHDAMTPKWSARGPYARKYDLVLFGIPEPIDLASLNGQSLELEQLGGMQAFEALRDAVLQIVRAPLEPHPSLAPGAS